MAEPRLTATAEALEVIERLQAVHGALVLHVSGGCCDGSSPMCLHAEELPPGPHDVALGAVAGTPVFIDGDLDARWKHPAFTLGVAPGAAGGFSLEGPSHVHFTLT